MSKQRITELTEQELASFLHDNGYELYNIEFVKEGKDWFLRVYIDLANGEEGKYIGTDDCEKVSKYLSAKFDELDPIEKNYYLEVSSPGLDRVLLKDKHYLQSIGKAVDISLYKAMDGKKSFSGTLKNFEDGMITIVDAGDAEITFSKEQITKAKLKIIF